MSVQGGKATDLNQIGHQLQYIMAKMGKLTACVDGMVRELTSYQRAC